MHVYALLFDCRLVHLGVNLQLAKGSLQRSLRKLKGHPPALKPRTVFRGTTEPFITLLITTCAGQQDDIGMKWRMSGGRVGPPETMNAYTSNDEHHTRTKSPTEEYRQVHLCALSADTNNPQRERTAGTAHISHRNHAERHGDISLRKQQTTSQSRNPQTMW